MIEKEIIEIKKLGKLINKAISKKLITEVEIINFIKGSDYKLNEKNNSKKELLLAHIYYRPYVLHFIDIRDENFTTCVFEYIKRRYQEDIELYNRYETEKLIMKKTKEEAIQNLSILYSLKQKTRVIIK